MQKKQGVVTTSKAIENDEIRTDGPSQSKHRY